MQLWHKMPPNFAALQHQLAQNATKLCCFTAPIGTKCHLVQATSRYFPEIMQLWQATPATSLVPKSGTFCPKSGIPYFRESIPA
jgi:hypothetical protein